MQRLIMICGLSAAMALATSFPIAHALGDPDADRTGTVAHKLNDTWMGLNVESETGVPVGYVSDATIDTVNGTDFLRISRFHDEPGVAEEYLYVDLSTTELAADESRVVVKGYFPQTQEIAYYKGKTGLDTIRKHARERNRL